MTGIYVAAGSNIEPERNLQLAVAALARDLFPAAVFTPVIDNRAAGFDGDDFINLVAGFDTVLAPPALLECLHAIEVECGRERDAPAIPN